MRMMAFALVNLYGPCLLAGCCTCRRVGAFDNLPGLCCAGMARPRKPRTRCHLIRKGINLDLPLLDQDVVSLKGNLLGSPLLFVRLHRGRVHPTPLL